MELIKYIYFIIIIFIYEILINFKVRVRLIIYKGYHFEFIMFIMNNNFEKMIFKLKNYQYQIIIAVIIIIFEAKFRFNELILEIMDLLKLEISILLIQERYLYRILPLHMLVVELSMILDFKWSLILHQLNIKAINAEKIL